MVGPSAREVFTKGTPVRFSERGVKAFVSRRSRCSSRTGIVVGFGREPYQIRVLRDGNAWPCTYHMDFWEVDKEAQRG